MNRKKFTRVQLHTVFACFIAYGSAYVSRHNLSVSLPALREAFSLSAPQVGLIASLYAVCYASGQLINGMLVDRVNARRHLMIGLLASSACNLVFGAAQSYGLLIGAWCLNGFAQSMLWTPIVKIISVTFDVKLRQFVSFLMSITMLIGNMLAWGIAGYMANLGSWRMGFYLPALITICCALISNVLMRETPIELPVPTTGRGAGEDRMPLKPLLFSTGLAAMLVSCACVGFVRDGIMTWGPTLLNAIGELSIEVTILLPLLIPIINILGVIAGRGCLRLLHGHPRLTVAFMALAAGVFCLLLIPFGLSNMVSCAVLLSLCCGFLSGANPMLSSLIPMDYSDIRRVGTVTGLLDCSFYIGSGLSGVAVGVLSVRIGWQGIFIAWALSCALAIWMGLLAHRGYVAFRARAPLPQNQGTPPAGDAAAEA